jgi:hypothetical protein
MNINLATVRKFAYSHRPSMLDQTKNLIRPVTQFKPVYNTAIPRNIVITRVFLPPAMARTGGFNA